MFEGKKVKFAKLSGFDELLRENLLPELHSTRKGKTSLEYSRSSSTDCLVSAYIYEATVPIDEIRDSCRVESFLRSLEGRFLRYRRMLIRDAVDSWRQGRNASVDVESRRRGDGHNFNIRFGNES